MTQDEIIELAIKGHASTRDAIRWAVNQEREACALICEELKYDGYEMVKDNPVLARKIRARGQA